MNSKFEDFIIWLLKTVVLILGAICMSTVIVLLIGIFLPNDLIDTGDILAILNPAFNTIIGAFVGLLGGLAVNNLGKDTIEEPEDLEEKSPEE